MNRNVNRNSTIIIDGITYGWTANFISYSNAEIAKHSWEESGYAVIIAEPYIPATESDGEMFHCGVYLRINK